jgi:hypothetical protein
MEEVMMAKRLSGSARRELIAAVRGRYLASTPPAKREILREFAAITGYHRKSAIRILNGSAEDVDVIRRQRLRVYDEAFCTTLIVLWEASDRVCGKRLQALLPSLVPALAPWTPGSRFFGANEDTRGKRCNH